MTSYIKPEVHNVLLRRQRRNEPRAWEHAQKLVEQTSISRTAHTLQLCTSLLKHHFWIVASLDNFQRLKAFLIPRLAVLGRI